MQKKYSKMLSITTIITESLSLNLSLSSVNDIHSWTENGFRMFEN